MGARASDGAHVAPSVASDGGSGSVEAAAGECAVVADGDEYRKNRHRVSNYCLTGARGVDITRLSQSSDAPQRETMNAINNQTDLVNLLLSLTLEQMKSVVATLPSDVADDVRLAWYAKNDPVFFAALSDEIYALTK